jgi:hypothetical protein
LPSEASVTVSITVSDALSTLISIPLGVDRRGLLPNDANHAKLKGCVTTGFAFKPIDLLHAIGSKTAALPSSQYADSIISAARLLFLMEFDGVTLWFKEGIDSDLQTPRSQEIGIGMMCLIALDCFDVLWDQLEVIPGPGRRFDYRAANAALQCIFESKGTKYRGNQSSQITDGLDKKETHRLNGETYDVALVISSHVGGPGEEPRILVADPELPDWRAAFDPDRELMYRSRHYARALQFAGFAAESRELYLTSGRIKERKQAPPIGADARPDAQGLI